MIRVLLMFSPAHRNRRRHRNRVIDFQAFRRKDPDCQATRHRDVRDRYVRLVDPRDSVGDRAGEPGLNIRNAFAVQVWSTTEVSILIKYQILESYFQNIKYCRCIKANCLKITDWYEIMSRRNWKEISSKSIRKTANLRNVDDFLLNCWDWSGAKECTWCHLLDIEKCWKISIYYVLVRPRSASIQPRTSPM